MAVKTWVPKAHATKNHLTVTFTGTFAGGDTVTATIGNKDLVITVGTGTALADVAITFRDAWNGASRIDGTGANTNTSNFGGYEFGEYREVEAVIYSASTTVVQLIMKKAGKSFTVSVADSAGAGTATLGTTTTATGPNYWSNGDNWDTGTVPANGDVVVLENSAVDILYGLPQLTLEVTMQQHQSFTGRMGLPPINNDDPSFPYPEYRDRFVRCDDAGAGTAITHLWGIGEGLGSSLLNFYHEDLSGTLAINNLVYNTGPVQTSGPAGQPTGSRSLNLGVVGSGAAATVTVLKGSVRITKVSGQASVPTAITVGYTTSQPSDSDVIWDSANGATTTVTQTGGRLLISSPGITTTTLTLNMSGGQCEVRTSGTVTTFNIVVLNATLIWNCTLTMTSIIVGSKGVVDAEKGAGAFTATTCDLFEGASWFDEYARGTYTAGIDLNRCGLDDVKLRVGNNRRLTLGTAA
jgi:hypothetical protein